MEKEITEVILKAALRDIALMAGDYAKAVKAYHDALINEGFTKNQALRLVIAHGYMPPAPNVGNGSKEDLET